eukprot:2383853-Amphidinium_carterae.2
MQRGEVLTLEEGPMDSLPAHQVACYADIRCLPADIAQTKAQKAFHGPTENLNAAFMPWRTR